MSNGYCFSPSYSTPTVKREYCYIDPAPVSLSLPLRYVTNLSGANVRLSPNTSHGNIIGIYANNVAFNVLGYVEGEDLAPSGRAKDFLRYLNLPAEDDAWYKTVDGYYVWANEAENLLLGLKSLR